MLQDIKVLSFDLDDTLWDCGAVMQHAERVLYDWLKKHFPKITRRYSVYEIREKRIAIDQRFPAQAHDMKFMRLQCLRELLNEMNYAEDFAQDAFDIFYQARNQVTLYADVLPGLDKLAAHYDLVAVTNGNADLSSIGIADYFKVYLTPEMVGCAKPDKKIFSALEQAIDRDAQEILHIGDNPSTDVDGARNAGMHAVWMNRDNQLWQAASAQPQHQVSCLTSLCELLNINTNGN